MNMAIGKTIALVLMGLSIVHHAKSLSVGNNTTPSRQGFTIFPSADTNNAMIGYTSFENGFKLEDNSTSCSYDGLVPVSGTVDLIGGNLYLMESLAFSDSAKINTMGSLYGNGKTVKLAPSITSLRSTATDLMLTLTSYNMQSAVSSVDFSTSYSYAIAVSAYNATEPEIILFHFDGVRLTPTQTIQLGTNRGGLSCRFQPGELNFAVGINEGSGAQLYTYRYDRATGVLTNPSTLNLPSGQTINAVSPSRDGNYLLIGRSAAAGGNRTELFMYGWNRATGALSTVLNQHLPEGSHRDITINGISWGPGGQYLVVGTQVAAVPAGSPELIIYHFNGTTLTATIQMELGLVPRGVDYSPSGTFVAVAFQGTTTQNLQIFAHNVYNGTLVPQTSAYINQTTDGLSVDWTADGNRLLFGAALVGGIGSFRQYNFNKTTTTLSLVNTFSFLGDVSSVRTLQSEDQYILGVGTRVYLNSGGYSNGFTLTMDNLTFELANDVTLGTPMGVLNKCSILGNDHAIDFDKTGTIIVLPNASLRLKDVTLRNFGGTQLRCFDNSATITLDNVRFLFKSPYFFDAGKLDVVGDFIVSGTNPFIYRSTGTSTIYSGGKWQFDGFSTLSYAPLSANAEGIRFVDRSSKLMFNNATLYSTATGLSLTKGELLIDGKMNIQSAAASSAEGIKWGDGVSVGNNLLVTVQPGARVNLESGYLVNKNIG